jgi:acylpyruvate hydrolase
MRLATIRTAGGTRAARLEGDELVLLNSPDVGTLLQAPDLEAAAREEDGTRLPLAGASFATLVPRPPKFACVGLNYRGHILETGAKLPDYPTLFAKFPLALIGAYDEIVLPSVSTKPDWEVELGVVIGAKVRHATPDQARAAIAGFTVVNDITMRDWQARTNEWLQGKTFESTTPVGPFLVTPDEVDFAADLEVRCEVDGEVMQQDRTSELVFGPVEVAAYLSEIASLEPGDVIAMGTTAGVGNARKPPVYLRPGQVVRTYVEGVGECVNTCVEERVEAR